MKLIRTLKNALPVSKKAHQAALAKAHHQAALAKAHHQAALAKAHHQADMDQSWMLAQLKQVTAANARLEAKLHQGCDIEDHLEG